MTDLKKIQLCEVHFSDQPTGGFVYRIPSDLDVHSTGIRVRVPFGRRSRVGIITRIFHDEDNTKFRDLIETIDLTPLIPPDILELTCWIADYYLCDWGEALAAAVPSGLKPTGKRKYALSQEGLSAPFIAEESGPAAKLWRALRKSPLTSLQIRRRFPNGVSLLEKFRRSGWVDQIDVESRRPVQAMTTEWRWSGDIDYKAAMESLPSNASRLKRGLEIVENAEGCITAKELSKIEPGMSSVMRNLRDKGWIRSAQVPFSSLTFVQEGLEETSLSRPELSLSQMNIVDRLRESLRSGGYQSFLLHGVTSSGKTLIYLEAIDTALALGKSVIVMVPEISLTPQLTGRIRRHLSGNVVVTHSRLSPGERREAWMLMRTGNGRVVVGPRSVVFAPVNDLGLVIIDEEHDDSYKQSEPAPRYNGRDAALYRAFKCGATVVLGSATPDIGSYNNADQGRYHLLELKERFGEGSLPDVWVVKWGIDGKGGCFSPRLQKSLAEVLTNKEQAILLVNRRGFSTIIRCPDCGEVATCPNCDITLRYHRDGQKLECHYCGYIKKPLDTCPKCHGRRLLYNGIGTQRVKREMEIIFPDARVERMDLDTTRRQGAHHEILARFARGEFDVLLGTQMVAKGHDFPGVSLVGIMLADLEWWKPDFRSVEKAYRLLSQAAGRTGRAGGGKVVIQALDPTHPLLRWVQGHNYRKLYEAEIISRRELRYPPFSNLIAVMLSGTDVEALTEAASELKDALEFQLNNCSILGPAPPPIERIENRYRRRLLLKMPPRNARIIKGVKKVVKDSIGELEKRYKRVNIRFAVDVDPVDV